MLETLEEPSRVEPFRCRYNASRSCCAYLEGNVLHPRGHGSAKTCSSTCTLSPAGSLHSSRRDLLRDKIREVGRGVLARRHIDGPLCAALLKTTIMCKARRRCTTLDLLGSLSTSSSRLFGQTPILPYNWVLDTDTGTGPIPPVTVSRVNAYSGGVLARALPEGLRYLST